MGLLNWGFGLGILAAWIVRSHGHANDGDAQHRAGRRLTRFFRKGLRLTFALWQRALAVVE